MTESNIKNGRLVMLWGRVFSYYAWPFVVFITSFTMSILALGKCSYYSDLSPFTLLVPLFLTLASILCIVKMSQKLQFRSIPRSCIPEIISDLDSLYSFFFAWRVVHKSENMIVLQPKNIHAEFEIARDIMNVNSERIKMATKDFRRGSCLIQIHD